MIDLGLPVGFGNRRWNPAMAAVSASMGHLRAISGNAGPAVAAWNETGLRGRPASCGGGNGSSGSSRAAGPLARSWHGKAGEPLASAMSGDVGGSSDLDGAGRRAAARLPTDGRTDRPGNQAPLAPPSPVGCRGGGSVGGGRAEGSRTGASNVHVLAGLVISTPRCPARISGIGHHVAADRRGGSGGMGLDCLDFAITGAVRPGLCRGTSRRPR
jgi:hypothetical protein